MSGPFKAGFVFADHHALPFLFVHNYMHAGLVWKVCRYTTAAPPYFDEIDDYVDGGILANNPTAFAMTEIQNLYSSLQRKLPISLVVSIGTGKNPADQLGRTDAHHYMYFGSHWLNFTENLSRAANMMSLLKNAVRS